MPPIKMSYNPKAYKQGMKIKKETVTRLLSYVLKYKFRMAVVLLSILFSALASVAGSLFLKTLIDTYIIPLLLQSQAGEAYSFAPLLRALTAMGAIYASGVLASFLYNRIMVTISQGTLREIRNEMFSRMQSLPIRYFDTHTHGDIMSHYTNDTDTLRQMISQALPQMFSSAVTILAVFCSMVYTSVPLTCFVVVCMFLIVRFSKKLSASSTRYFIQQQKTLGRMNGFIEEMINGQKVVKVFCHEQAAKDEFDQINDTLEEDSFQANKFANTLMPIMANLTNLLYIMTAVAGGTIALTFGGLTLGGVASFLQLTRSFAMPINQISTQVSAIIMALAGAQRIFELMDEQPEQDSGVVTLVNAGFTSDGELIESDTPTGTWAWKYPKPDGTVSYTRLEGRVTMDDVDFGYTPEKTVLHHITLFAEPGQKVAFVGATGAGKTTITNLINRFYDIADGKIRYDGININKIQKSSLRRSLGVVLQDVNLFTGTVMDNIRYGKPDATDEECIAAARLAHADEFIRMLPDGYQTVLTGNGASLSQGQRQLISIARAAVADPPVMILDEATSSIDTRTEAIVQKGMDSLMTGRTVFVIAHRLSTVQNSDVIMVLENGEIIERGSHEKLIAEKGKYYQLYTGAFELE